MFCKRFLKSQNKIDFFHPKTKAEWTCNEKSNKTIDSCLNKPQLNYLWVPYNGSIILYIIVTRSNHFWQMHSCQIRWFIDKISVYYCQISWWWDRLCKTLKLVLKTCISTLSRRYEHSFGLCWHWSSIQKGENSETIKYTRLHTDLWAS